MRARYFATAAHAAVGQLRKYTNEPYIVHPAEVAQILVSVGIYDSEVLQAAWLHDTVEDTDVSVELIHNLFGERVARLVREVTDASTPEDGNRAIRKAIDRDNLEAASPEAQSIKLADLISNTSSIVRHDKKFAKVYLEEKEQLLSVLTKGHPELMKLARQALEKAKLELSN